MNFKVVESVNAKDAWMQQVEYNRDHLEGLPMAGGIGSGLSEAVDPDKALELKKESTAPIIFYGWQYKTEAPVEIVPEEHTEETFKIRKERIVNDYNKLYSDKPNANRYSKENEFVFYVLYNNKKVQEAKKKKHGIDSVNYNAGNVEHNLKMFNMMNNSTEAVDTNPVSGPFGAGLSEDINTFENKGNNNMLDNELRDYVLELVLAEYETGHVLVDDFDSFRSFKRLAADDGYRATKSMFDFYTECRDLGPSGFYEEYKDELDFSDEFIAEYGSTEEITDEEEYVEESLTEMSNMEKLRNMYPELNECGTGEIITEDTLNEGPKQWWNNMKKKRAAKTDPQAAQELADTARGDRADKYIKALGGLIAPTFSDKYADHRFMIDGEMYDQDGYRAQVKAANISNLLKSGKILQSDPNSEDMQMLRKAIDTVVIDPKGKIIRRGLEDLSSKPLTYIMGRTDLTDIPNSKSSKAIFDLIQGPVKQSDANASPAAETPTANEEPSVTNEPTTDATSKVDNWVNSNSVKAAVNILAKRKKNPVAIYYTSDGTAISGKDVTAENAGEIFVDKSLKTPFMKVMETIKDGMKQRKESAIKRAAIFGESYDDSLEYDDMEMNEDIDDDVVELYNEDCQEDNPIVEYVDNDGDDYDVVLDKEEVASDCDLTTITYTDLVSNISDHTSEDMAEYMISEINAVAEAYGIAPEALVIVTDDTDDLNPDALGIECLEQTSRFVCKYRCGDNVFYADTRSPAYLYFKSIDQAEDYCTTCGNI